MDGGPDLENSLKTSYFVLSNWDYLNYSAKLFRLRKFLIIIIIWPGGLWLYRLSHHGGKRSQASLEELNLFRQVILSAVKPSQYVLFSFVKVFAPMLINYSLYCYVVIL